MGDTHGSGTAAPAPAAGLPAAPVSAGHPDDLDVVIVGGGPAGAAAAISALRRRPDARVRIMDRAAFPRDKTCGDGVGPDGVEVLRRLDVAHVLDGAACVDRLRIATSGGASAAGEVPQPGYVLPRRELDARLLAAAIEHGAEVVRERVTRVESCAGRVVVNGHVAAGVVIGADGAHSVVRRAVGAGPHPRRDRAVSLRGYAPAVGRRTEIVFRLPRDPWPAYAWAFPTGQGQDNVGVVVLDGRRELSRAGLRSVIGALLPEWRPSPSTLRGFSLPLSTGRPAVAHGQVLLAGDAAGLVNPLSGEGIATALISGMHAGACAVGDDPSRAYAAALDRHLARHLRHVGCVARLFASHTLVDRTIAAAGASSDVFSTLAGLTVGTGTVSLAMLRGILAPQGRRRRSCSAD